MAREPSQQDINRAARQRAVERLVHKVAAIIHQMMAEQDMTTAQVQAALRAAECDQAEIFLDLLAGNANAWKVSLTTLADIAWILQIDWNFHIVKLSPSDEATPRELGREQSGA